MFFSLTKLSNILVFIGILKIPDPMGHLPIKLTSIHTAIRIHHASLALFYAIDELTDIHELNDFIFVVTVAVLDTIIPLALVVLLGCVQDTSAVLEVV
jgi:hypothetical protein